MPSKEAVFGMTSPGIEPATSQSQGDREVIHSTTRPPSSGKLPMLGCTFQVPAQQRNIALMPGHRGCSYSSASQHCCGVQEDNRSPSTRLTASREQGVTTADRSGTLRHSELAAAVGHGGRMAGLPAQSAVDCSAALERRRQTCGRQRKELKRRPWLRLHRKNY